MLNADDIKTYTNNTIALSKKNYKKILDYELANNNYKTFLFLIVNEDNYTETMFYQLTFWQFVSDSEEVRKASSNAESEFRKYMNELHLNEFLYVKLLGYYQAFSTNLSILQRRYLRNYIRLFEMAGASLNNQDKEKLKEIEETLINLETKFVTNIADCNKTILLNDNDLKGLPTEKIESFFIKDNKRIIDFKYPTFKMCMKYIDDSNIRKLLDYEYNSMCKETNTKILVEILFNRQIKAELLGKKNHATLVQSQLMIKEPENVREFLNDIHPLFDTLFLEEIRFLLRLKEQDCKNRNINFDGVINHWDINYYFNLAAKKIVGNELDTINNYFSLEQVKNVCFNLLRHLLGIKFVKKKIQMFGII